MDAILEIDGVTRLYKNGRGIRDISFNVYRGDVFGLFGPNGAGKTTLLKAITGLVRPSRGKITVFGYDAAEQHEQAMARIGCIIESDNAYEYMTACQNLRLAAAYYPSLPAGRIEEVLQQVGLYKYRNEKAKSFSTGMKQRLALASALLSEPELVILDEPTNGLDIEGMVDFRMLIQNMAAEKQMTFIISSHMISEMERMCNRIGLIGNGELLSEGLAAELLQEGQSLEQYYIESMRRTKEDVRYA